MAESFFSRPRLVNELDVQGTHRRKKVDEKSCVTFLLCEPRLVRPTNLMSRMNGKKTHTQSVY